MKKMNKESIIRKLKENKKSLLIFSIIFISGLIVGISISTIKPPKSKPKFYIAIDDINIRGGPDPFADTTKIIDDSPSVLFGYSSGYYGFIMRFDLRNKPKSWSKCEISLYIYKKVRDWVQGFIYLFGGNWTEEEWDEYYHHMDDFEIYWRIEESIGDIYTLDIGFSIIDITEYIDDITTDTFSIAMMPKKDFDGLGYIYSSEWNGTNPSFPYGILEAEEYKSYLPQLIWT